MKRPARIAERLLLRYPALMAIFEWDDSYSVSVKRLDEQHKHLVALLNELNEEFNQGRGDEVLRRILTELSTYTMTHFAAEEALMLRTGFPGYEQHQREHHELTEQLRTYLGKYQDGSAKIGVDVLLFMRDWLVEHIAATDKEYSAHLNACGID